MCTCQGKPAAWCPAERLPSHAGTSATAAITSYHSICPRVQSDARPMLAVILLLSNATVTLSARAPQPSGNPILPLSKTNTLLTLMRIDVDTCHTVAVARRFAVGGTLFVFGYRFYCSRNAKSTPISLVVRVPSCSYSGYAWEGIAPSALHPECGSAECRAKLTDTRFAYRVDAVSRQKNPEFNVTAARFLAQTTFGARKRDLEEFATKYTTSTQCFI